VEADPARIEHVFVNLLANASRSTPPGGRIEVSAAEEGEEIVVRVRDNGMGIPPDRLAHAFDMIVPGHPEEPTSGQGLGVGLSLVRSLVELHGGQVSASSDGLGHGSEFLVTLPAMPGPPTATGAVAGAVDRRSEDLPLASGTGHPRHDGT
jgi:signal transduction histidine kinase